MSAAVKRILVVGGNGFIGSSVCRLALARGMEVTSISSSGNPYHTPKGHTPAWVKRVQWHKAPVEQPDTYSHLLSEATGGVVHTLGTLFPSHEYKRALRTNDLFGILRQLFINRNPLEVNLYDSMNHDSALIVLRTMLNYLPTPTSAGRVPFIYLSAEDVFRPFIPDGYIRSKRAAERMIAEITEESGASERVRSVFIRPSLVYHPHERPLSTPPAALLDLSVNLHEKLGSLPTPAGFLRTVAGARPSTSAGSSATELGSPLLSVANALTTPPIHVDHVAEAICVAIQDENITGPVDVARMRQLIGWTERGSQRHLYQYTHEHPGGYRARI
ncbi:NAD(P)-binding protein [Fistulina hepatica ATCC 64428]|nr:NAD(P)-binding protein [Fistulina hepatica ATCC 64428]